MPIERTRIAVVGATGAVGREALSILASWGVPAHRVTAIASPRSVGRTVPYGDTTLTIRSLNLGVVASQDVVVCCASSAVARSFIPEALAAGVRVVDASSAYREDPAIPLVVPEINGFLLDRSPPPPLVASPNCSTIILLTALDPIRRRFGVESITVSTYQAVSGAGAAGLEELRAQTTGALRGAAPAPSVFPEPCAFNCFSHNSAVDPDTGLNVEERKIIAETRKIWDDAAIRINPTCIRVPVERAHSESVTIRLGEPASTDELRAVLREAPSVRVIDDRATGRFPTPRAASGGDDILVGRLRPAPDEPVDRAGRSRSHALWICGDQLRKGAALNAIQIARAIAAPAREPVLA